MKKSWYCHHNLKPHGPFSLDEIRAKIHRGEIGPSDLISDEEQGGRWQAAKDWGVFEAPLFPATQNFVPGLEVDKQAKEWVLLAEDPATGKLQQEGPYSLQILHKFLQENKVSPQQHVWKPGLSGWCKLQDRPEFENFISANL